MHFPSFFPSKLLTEKARQGRTDMDDVDKRDVDEKCGRFIELLKMDVWEQTDEEGSEETKLSNELTILLGAVWTNEQYHNCPNSS